MQPYFWVTIKLQVGIQKRIMMVESKIYKGIEYIQVSELPVDQQEIIKNTVHKTLFIKILINDKILHDCIQFKDYIAWFENVFNAQQNGGGKHSGKHIKNPVSSSLTLTEH